MVKVTWHKCSLLLLQLLLEDQIPFILALFCFVRPPSAIWLGSQLLWFDGLCDALLFLSLLSASVLTNFPRSGMAIWLWPLFGATDALTRTEGCTVGCDIGGWFLGAPGILPPTPPRFEPRPVCLSSEKCYFSDNEYMIKALLNVSYIIWNYIFGLISWLSNLPVGMAGSGAPGPTLGVLFDIWEVFCRARCVCIFGLDPPKSFFGSRIVIKT